MMRHFLLLTILFLSMSCSQAQIKSLDDFKWESRILIIYAGEKNSYILEKQLIEINQEKEEFKDRDLVVIILQNEKVDILNSSKTHQFNFNEILNDYSIDENTSYQNLLIGKDGGIKLKSESPISTEKLFNTIDAMPMRKREMRDGN